MFFDLDDNVPHNSSDMKMPLFAVANITGNYDGSPGKLSIIFIYLIYLVTQLPKKMLIYIYTAKKIQTNTFHNQNSKKNILNLSGGSNRRIRRSDEELRRAAECITRGQTFQTVSDQFNIPISTIRFYMARKGILPRRKRGRACAGPVGIPMPGNYNSPGNTSPIGPPYHIVHYKLPALGVSKLK